LSPERKAHEPPRAVQRQKRRGAEGRLLQVGRVGGECPYSELIHAGKEKGSKKKGPKVKELRVLGTC